MVNKKPMPTNVSWLHSKAIPYLIELMLKRHNTAKMAKIYTRGQKMRNDRLIEK